MMWSSLYQNIMRRGCNVGYRQIHRHASSDMKRTCLYDYHIKHGGKMVPFAGWEMPVQYKDSIIESHKNIRSGAGIFDVSHMLQTKVSGKDCVQFMESLCVADVAALQENQGTLSLFTNARGGIIDDLIINKTDQGYLYVVSNAGCADKDLPLMMIQAELLRSKGLDVTVEVICNGLIALQGPGMVQVLQPGLEFNMNDLPFMTTRACSVYGIADCRVTRCGYTGEDGVEISVPSDDAVRLVDDLLNASTDIDTRLTGLGARDSLRLEAGLCLYGNDIDEDTTPIEATLAWTIGKRRKAEGGFPGSDIILNQIKTKPKTRRVGFTSKGAPARGGTEIYDTSGGKVIGKITSGCPSPSLKHNVAMGYVQAEFFKPGTKVQFLVRNKTIEATVAKMPFLPANYYFGK